MISTYSRRAAIPGAAVFSAVRIVKARSLDKLIAISSANRNNGGVNARANACEVIPGRCGDSPLIGGGLGLDQGSQTLVENMRGGDCPKRVARNFDNDEKRLQQVDLSFYVLRKTANVARHRCGREPGSRLAPTEMPTPSRPSIVWTERASRPSIGRRRQESYKKDEIPCGFVYNNSSPEEQVGCGLLSS